MKDWLFYPLILIIAGAMIVLALSFGEKGEFNPEDGIVLKNEALNRLVASPGTTIKSVGAGDTLLIELRANIKPEDAPSAGVFFSLNDRYIQAYDQKQVIYSVTLRKAAVNGTDNVLLGFFSPQSSTGWKNYSISDDFQTLTIVQQVKQNSDGEDYLFLGIWPDPKGQSRGVLISEYSVKLMDE